MKLKANEPATMEYAQWIHAERIFPSLDVPAEFQRARDWIWVHRDEGRKCTRRFFDNWLARAASDTYNPKPCNYIP